MFVIRIWFRDGGSCYYAGPSSPLQADKSRAFQLPARSAERIADHLRDMLPNVFVERA